MLKAAKEYVASVEKELGPELFSGALVVGSAVFSKRPKDVDLLVVTRRPLEKHEMSRLVDHYHSFEKRTGTHLVIEPVFLSSGDLKLFLNQKWVGLKDLKSVQGTLYRSMLGLKTRVLRDSPEVARLRDLAKGKITRLDKSLWLAKRVYAGLPDSAQRQLYSDVALHLRQKADPYRVLKEHLPKAKRLSLTHLEEPLHFLKKDEINGFALGIVLAGDQSLKRPGRASQLSALGLGIAEIGH
ncbi:MAG: hypothetical protein V1834_04970 [Candidatus Micrarchaeota archaeon]